MIIKSKRLSGDIKPESNQGMAVITEYMACKVLGDCVNCNEIRYNSRYDLISDKYGTINVKSSKIRSINEGKTYHWHFSLKESNLIPTHYIFIAFGEGLKAIDYVWIIPPENIPKRGVTMSSKAINAGIFSKYEVNSTEYNNIYKNLNLQTFKEFKNLNKLGD